MEEQEKRQLIARLHRLEGQVRALEAKLANDNDAITTVIQMKAVIAAARGCLNEYARSVTGSVENEETRQALLKLLLTGSS